jgi:hypothetical protein
VTLVSDAAKWIWVDRADALRRDLGLRAERFHEIVDYFHALERLGDFAKSRDGWTELMRPAWLKVQKERLKAGDIEAIEDFLADTERLNGENLSTERKYWARHRLRFAAFRERGLPNGSAAVESAVCRVVNLRLKGASICWTEENAEGLLHLRAQAKSGRWDELEAAVLAHDRLAPYMQAAEEGPGRLTGYGSSRPGGGSRSWWRSAKRPTDYVRSSLLDARGPGGPGSGRDEPVIQVQRGWPHQKGRRRPNERRTVPRERWRPRGTVR